MHRNGNLAIAIHKGRMVRIKYIRPSKKNIFLSKIRKHCRVIRPKVGSCFGSIYAYLFYKFYKATYVILQICNVISIII